MSRSNWKKGDFALRKGKLCEITHIDYTIDPPAVTVRMLASNNEVGTEFSRLTKVAQPRWSCPICTFDNDIKEKLCSVCQQGNRTNDIYSRALTKIENAIKEQSILQVNGTQPTHWACTVCTFNNAMFKDECQMCMTIRTHDAKLIYPDGTTCDPSNNNNKNNKNKNKNNSNENINNESNNNNHINNDNNNNKNEQKMNEINNENNNQNKNMNDKANSNNNNESENNIGNKNDNNDKNDNENNKNDSDNEKNNNNNNENGSGNEDGTNDSGWTLIEKNDLHDNNDPYLEVE